MAEQFSSTKVLVNIIANYVLLGVVKDKLRRNI